MKCPGFGSACVSTEEDCSKCKKGAPKRYNKCRKLTNELVSRTSNTDEEIEKWLRERKKK